MTDENVNRIRNLEDFYKTTPRMAAGPTIWYDNWNAVASIAFIAWWTEFYGSLADFGAEDLETDAADDYYIRMSFALMGWLAKAGAETMGEADAGT